jgi:hypothetical protein
MKSRLVRFAALLSGSIALAAIILWLLPRSVERPASQISPEIQTIVPEPELSVKRTGEIATNYGTFQSFVAKTEQGHSVRFDVDDNSEVVGFYREHQTASAVILTLEQARSRAIDFGKLHFPDPELLDSPPDIAELIDLQDGRFYYRFVWQGRDTISGAYLPQTLRIEINAESGIVDSYVRLYERVTVDTKPQIESLAAEQIAINMINPYFSVTAKPETTLAVTRPIWKIEGGNQLLVWQIHLSGAFDKEKGITPSAIVFVDALTGTLLHIEPVLPNIEQEN